VTRSQLRSTRSGQSLMLKLEKISKSCTALARQLHRCMTEGARSDDRRHARPQ
jgi:hypothetical protein